jgi:hypothetical protein
MNCKTNFDFGITLFEPNRLLQWKQSKNEIIELFAGEKLEKITDDYYTIFASVFQKDFSCNIGFHFEYNVMRKLEFFRNREYYIKHNIFESYSEFQTVLENFFGIPTSYQQRNCCLWKFKIIEISHCIYERFGPEEHTEIKIL